MAIPMMNRAARERMEEWTRAFWAELGAEPVATFRVGEEVTLYPGVPAVVEKIVNNVRTGLKLRVRIPEGDQAPFWVKASEVNQPLAREEDWEDMPYQCRSCDAILGDSPRPCPRCDGLPGYGSDQYHAEVDAELRHHQEVYGDHYGDSFNPIPFNPRRYA